MNFGTKPYEHQLQVLELSKNLPYYAFFWEQGTGKSKILIDTAFYLQNQRKINGVLILAPNGVHLNWFVEQFPIHKWNVASTTVMWKAQRNKTIQRQIDLICKGTDTFDWFFMNIEGIRTKQGFSTANKFLRNHKALFAIDESSTIKNPKAKQTKSAILLSQLAPYKRILSGTPITQGALDIYSQCKFLDLNALPYNSYTAFKCAFAVEKTMVLGQRSFTKVVGFRNLNTLEKLLNPFSSRKLLKECIDLPKQIFQKRFVPLNNNQRKIYQEVLDMAFLILTEKEKTGTLTINSVLTQMMKLRQVTSGFIINDQKTPVSISDPKIDAIHQIIEEINGKLIIWSVFKHAIRAIVSSLSKRYGRESVVSYFGDTSLKVRSESVERFQTDNTCKFFVSNRAGCFGLNLTSATTCIYHANDYSLETRLQSKNRNYRIGQTRSVLYIDLISPGTIDEPILHSLESKQKISDIITGDWRNTIKPKG